MYVALHFFFIIVVVVVCEDRTGDSLHLCHSILCHCASTQVLSVPILEKVIQLSESLNRSHQQMQECHLALKASIKRQNEIKTYYQTLVRHMNSQKESQEAELRERIRLLEEEKYVHSDIVF